MGNKWLMRVIWMVFLRFFISAQNDKEIPKEVRNDKRLGMTVVFLRGNLAPSLNQSSGLILNVWSNFERNAV